MNLNIITQILVVSTHAFFMWLIDAIYFRNAEGLSRTKFIAGHYLTVIISAALTFFIYNKFFKFFSPFATMAIAMITVFSIEAIVFTFFYNKELWFLNFVDYIFPIFLGASVIYFMGTIIR